MATIIIFAVLFAVTFFGASGEFGEAVMGFVFGGVIGFLVGMFIGMAAYSGTYTGMTEAPLINIADNQGVKGTFFLGTGIIANNPVYSWYEQTADNSYERRDAAANDSTVHYLAKDAKPYYTKRVKCYKGGLKTWGLSMGGGCSVEHYDFFVPRGTITNDYRLDAE